MISLNTAYHSLRAAGQELNTAARQQSRSLARLSSGSEELGGGAASSSAGAEFRFRNAALRQQSLEGGMVGALSYLEAQAAGLLHLESVVERLSSLVTRMNDVTQGSQDRDAGFEEFNQLREELWETRKATFNGRELFYVAGAAPPADPTVLLGVEGDRTMTVSQSDFGTQFAWDALLGWATVGTGADPAMSFVQTAEDAAAWGASGLVSLQEDLAQRLATNGAERSRLLHSLDRSKSRALEDTLAASRIADTDVAREVATLARASLRTQSSAVMHTQANVLAEAALRVLVG